MLRWSRGVLIPAAAQAAASAAAAGAAAVGLEKISAGDAAQQTDALHRLLREHENGVAHNARGPITIPNTYGTESALVFDQFNLGVLPSVNGGTARQPLRAKLLSTGAVAGVRDHVVAPWQETGQRRVVVFGCRSLAYLRRQLRADSDHSFLVVDSSLKDLTEAAAALRDEFGPRVYFLRCESMFTCLEVLTPESVDVALVPMPVPYWSKQGSYRRLVHFDFFCAVHRTLRARAAPSDPRGVVLFTDCEPYAAFMMEHLEEAKLMVPYTRKNPQDIFQRWLPQNSGTTPAAATDDENKNGSGDQRRSREFPKQREREVVALAAAKSGPTTAEAVQLLEGYTYARKYYRDFSNLPPTE